jgi:uncharacterized coiled-coil protein SlyX
MSIETKKYPILSALFFVGSLFSVTLSNATTLEDNLKAMEAANKEAGASQERIQVIQGESQKLANEYKRLLQNADRQEQVSEELNDRLAQQRTEIDNLREQLAGRDITQQRITPLMRSMADNLEQFIALDLPFHQEERLGRAIKVKQMLNSSSYSLPEQYRAVLSAYQQELEFGRSIEAWRGELQLTNEEGNKEPLTVEFLRMGRLALYFQTMDGGRSGMWNREKKTWEELPRRFNPEIKHGLGIAHNQQAPQMLALPFTQRSASPQEVAK